MNVNEDTSYDLDNDIEVESQEDIEVGSQSPNYQEEASKMGWKPQEEWVGNPDDWVDAKEYVARGEFFDRIKNLSSSNKRLEKKLSKIEENYKVLSEHHQRVSEAAYSKALKDLKAQRREALDTGDYDSVDEIEEMIDDLKKEDPKLKEKNTAPELHPEVEEWIENNSEWYRKDPILTGAADALAMSIVSKNPNAGPKEVLEQVTKTLKEEFPNKFGLNKRSSVVEPGESSYNGKVNSKPKVTARNLNPQQREIGKQLVSDGAIKDLDTYAQELYSIGAIR